MKPLGATASWSGGEITTRARAVLAPNPGWMTLDGTNTWVLHEPGSAEAAIVDPGPEDPVHLAAVHAAVAELDAEVTCILLTHGHEDHAAAARTLHHQTGAPVLALDHAHRLGGEGLQDGDVLTVGGLEIQVVGTPGHTSDSLAFAIPADSAILTGDTILGRGTAVIAHPDGDLGDYFGSLARLAALAQAQESAWVLPGHGPACTDPAGLIADYQSHRRQRLEQVAVAQVQGASSVEEILDACYPEITGPLRAAARLSVLAQLEYLGRSDEAYGAGSDGLS
jgi:glyoxylase-like metal-dependent hydrolase (beta-lactamase superfamily II)